MKRFSKLSFLLVIVMALLVLTACERPAEGGGDPPTPDPALQVPTQIPEIPTVAPDPGTVDNTTDTTGSTTENTGDAATTGDGTETTGDTGDGTTTGDSASTSTPVDNSGNTTSTTDTSTTDNATSGTQTSHTVKAGESLSVIAELYEATVAEIAAANGITNIDAIDVGQVLVIPAAGTVTTPPTSTEERVHVVQAGDNLFRIGLAYGVTAEELAAYNNIADITRIDVGQIINIPPQQ